MKNAAGIPKGGATFKPLPMGAGGFVTGFSISTNGATKVVRCDVHGAYVRGSGETVWRNMFNSSAIPAGLISGNHQVSSYADSSGCAEAVVAPSDPTLILMNYDGWLLKSTNTGVTFANTGMPRKTLFSNSSSARVWGKTIAVDPNNTLVMMHGTQGQSIYYSLDGGTTFTDLVVSPGATFSGQATAHFVACDPTSTQTSGIRQRWVYSRYGTGVYMSTTGPNGTYTLMTSTPTNVQRLKFDAFGTLWATSNGISNNLFKWTSAGGWVNITTTLNTQFSDVAVDPFNANNVIAIDGAGLVRKSIDGGATWPSSWDTDNSHNPPQQQVRGKTIKYLDFGPSQQFNLFNGNIEFDTATSGKLWCPAGVGVFSTTPPATSASPIVWTEDSEGIEELVSQCVTVPPGGVPLIGVWDQGIFRIENLTRLTNPQKSPYNATDTIANGLRHPSMVQPVAGLDYAADNPAWVAVMQHGGFYSLPINNPHSGYSTDYGVTWNMFPVAPPNKPYAVGGGCMAVGNVGNVIIGWNANARWTYTKDGGNTWADVPIPGIPANNTEQGWEYQGASYFLNKNLLVYDKTGGAFYAFNYGPSAVPGLRGFWKSSNQGDTWTQVYSGVPSGGSSYVYHFHLKAVPGNAGHLFYTTGQGQSDSLYRSTNGAVAWSACTTNSGLAITGVTDIGFGKAAPGQTYPAIYFFGQVGSQYGVWRSDDNLVTATLLAAHPGGNIDVIACVAGDPGVYGRVYLLTSGSGALVGDYDFTLKLAA